MSHPSQSEAVESLLLGLEADAEQVRKVMMENVLPPGSPVFPLDLLAFAAAKRHASTTSAFVSMVRSWNMVIARALLRVHIDTSLRFSAAWHVADPHKFATSVLKGEQINKIKTRTGQRLTDSHLVQLHLDERPWLPAVYERLSGYVHFSGAHIFDSIGCLSEKNQAVQFLISDKDFKFPELSWVEVIECFREATTILETFLQGWGATKKLSDSQLLVLRSKN